MIFSRHVLCLSVLFQHLVSADVSCGGHSAETCAKCPYNESGNYMGKGWCNGECHWGNNECLDPVVSCGGDTKARSCDKCPSGESGCGTTDCAWHTWTDLCRDAFSDNVRTASVHLNQISPLARPAWWFQRVVPVSSASVTYFSTNGHSFGYGGIQEVDASTGRVLFSLWDQGGCDQDVDPKCNDEDKAKTVACGTGVDCLDFNGEGTGRKSQYDRKPFEIDTAYYFVTQAVYLGNRRMEYTGYFYEDSRWRLLSRIQVSTNKSEEWWIKETHSFVEQWAAQETTRNRAALFGPSYLADVDGTNFQQVKTARFSHGTLENHEHVNAWQEGADWQHAVGIATGGDTKQEVERNHLFTYPAVAPYEELTSFQGSISCLNGAGSAEEIEACLDAPSTKSPTSGAPSVNCGGHRAETCAKCPYKKSGEYMGKHWCNGECNWAEETETCLDAPVDPCVNLTKDKCKNALKKTSAEKPRSASPPRLRTNVLGANLQQHALQ